jgi:DNA-binding NtrC family response regulator
MSLPTSTGRSLKDALGGPERQIIMDMLQANNWNRSATADALGINRTTLYKKMKKLGLQEQTRNRAGMMPIQERDTGNGDSRHLSKNC